MNEAKKSAALIPRHSKIIITRPGLAPAAGVFLRYAKVPDVNSERGLKRLCRVINEKDMIETICREYIDPAAD